MAKAFAIVATTPMLKHGVNKNQHRTAVIRMGLTPRSSMGLFLSIFNKIFVPDCTRDRTDSPQPPRKMPIVIKNDFGGEDYE